MGGRKQLTNEVFIERAINVHGDKYDYSKIQYVNSSTKLIFICKEHGEFLQRPDMHLNGSGCKKCGLKNMVEKQSLTNKIFIERAINVHGDKYDYSKTEYVNSEEKLLIICKDHGEFFQIPHNHLNGKGCPKCANESTKNKLCSSNEEFIERSIKLHNNDNYSYHKVEYINSTIPVCIHCMVNDTDGNSHGDFFQTPGNHLQGQGCPKCTNKSTSNGEKELIKYLSNFVEVEAHNRNILKDNKELDIYIPSLKIAIEYNGLYWHSELSKDKHYHKDKTKECSNKDIKLIHVFEDEWLNKNNIVKSRLLNIIGITKTKYFARKTTIKVVNISDERNFLEQNHIQGYVASKICYGLYLDNKLISIMSFGNLRKNLGNESKENFYELLRFCNLNNTTVIGGASKLLKHFIKIYKPIEIISYADIRWSSGNLYEKLGFSFVKNTEPNYYYLIGGKRKNRFNYRKDILVSKYGCSIDDTEHNFCYNKGWYRIYDCGMKLYKLTL